jgi:Domain of unknown function (DUF4340)
MRQIAVLSVALVVSLVWSYRTWTDDSEEISDDVVFVYQASEKDLQKVAWNSEQLKVTVEKKKDDRGEYLWVSTEEVKKKLPSTMEKPPGHPGEDGDEGAHGEEGEPAAEVPTEIKRSQFVASAQGEEMWKSFAPLQALRELPAEGIDKATFGLAGGEDAATIEIVAGRGATQLQLGGETYGSKDRYVQLDGKVYLVDDATLRPLQYASSRLVERSLYPLPDAEIEAVEVELAPGKVVRWTHANKDDAAKAFWARSESPDKEDDVGATWLDKVFKLKLREYVDRATITTPLEPVVTYTVQGKGESWPVRLVKTEVNGKTQWYADAAYNRSLVSLTESLVRNVVDDLDELD